MLALFASSSQSLRVHCVYVQYTREREGRKVAATLFSSLQMLSEDATRFLTSHNRRMPQRKKGRIDPVGQSIQAPILIPTYLYGRFMGILKSPTVLLIFSQERSH